jgi:hypothetical protein
VDEQSLASCRVEGFIWKRQSAGVGPQGPNTGAGPFRKSTAKSGKVVRVSIHSNQFGIRR